MKNIILIISILLAVSCGKGKEAQTKTKVTEPVKELTAEEKVVGEYENKLDGDTARLVLLKNGIAEGYENGKKREGEHRWKVVEGEIHITASDEKTGIWRINKDGSLTVIARISNDGKREEAPKESNNSLRKQK